ncbi:protease inhibitor I9 family protein [Bacillus salacetis]|uniref:protease inhibitor I9 family protein n=1 Tax=Bacillus salacetis TaxID=2315464 RepID=UPI003BA3A93E
MNTSVYIDPSINLSTSRQLSIIIEFKILPAHSAVAAAKSQGKQLTLEEAESHVEQSHQTFRKELQILLEKNRIPYTIQNTYTNALNGVAMELPANEIRRLMKSTVIARIHPNKQVHLDPPVQPY